MAELLKSFFILIGTILLILILIAAIFWVIMLLWNAIIPDLFPGVSELTFWKAAGLSVLCSLLFKDLDYKKKSK